MTHEGRFLAGTGVWTGGAFEASRRLSCRRRCHRTTSSPLAWARANSHAPARSTKPQLACGVRGDVAHTAAGGVEDAQRIQHEIHGAVPAVGKGQHCGALGYGSHARLRAGIAEAPLRGAAPLVSSATLRRNASMRLTTVCGGAKVFLRSGTAPACLAFRCASRASS
jgi:hypothetical protein